MNNHHRILSVSFLLVLAASVPEQSSYAQSPCVLIDNDIARLQCYDDRERQRANISVEPTATVATPIESAPVIATEPVVVAPQQIQPDPVPETVVATEVPAEPAQPVTVVERIIYVELAPEPEEESLPEEVRSTIVNVIFPLDRHRIFVLENGDRWQETREYGLEFEVGSDVYLKKGFLNAYNMTSGRNTIRVAKSRR